ncbi:MAG: helix-turn-helix domain-containing protein [Oscillospiraceae bacterium]|nr:helix-turn-helix domain-containing protein [Oscillospiraceae bacterium]
MATEKKFYTIAELAKAMGFTDRTIRNYIRSGKLKGEMVDGEWRFSEEAISDLFEQKEVIAKIRQKRHTIVYDYIANSRKKKNEVCIIIDLCDDSDTVKQSCDFILDEMNSHAYKDITYAAEVWGKHGRIILSGDAENVMKLVNKYYSR